MRIGTWLLLFYTLLMQIFCAFLLGFHCNLMNKNVTTNEFLKQRLVNRDNPMRAKTFCGRLLKSLCRSHERSLVTNDLVRISLLIESLFEREEKRKSAGETPTKLSKAMQEAMQRKIDRIR